MILGVLLCACTATASAAPMTADRLQATCPSASEIAQFDADFTITYDSDPTAGTLVCTAASGSADLTRLKERMYQGLRLARAMTFSRPLPWTPLSLYDWLKTAAPRIHVTDGHQAECCDASGAIVIGNDPNAYGYLSQLDASGLLSLLDVLVHEARHREGPVHTCGTDDQTVAEEGAWTVEAQLRLWEGLYGGAVLTGPAADPGIRRTAGLLAGAQYLDDHICDPRPSSDVAPTVGTPHRVRHGRTFRMVIDVANRGTDTSEETFAVLEIPKGMRFDGGDSHCALTLATRQMICALGALAPGSSVRVRPRFRVTARSGARIRSDYLSGLGEVRAVTLGKQSNVADDGGDYSMIVRR